MFLSLPLYRNFAYAAAKDSHANCFWKMYSEYKHLFCIGEIYSYVAIVLYSSRSHWSIQFACELKWWRKKKRGTVEKKIPSCVALSKGFFLFAGFCMIERHPPQHFKTPCSPTIFHLNWHALAHWLINAEGKGVLTGGFPSSGIKKMFTQKRTGHFNTHQNLG